MKKLIMLAALGLAASSTGALAQSKFGASFRWCGSSPEFRLSGVPKGAATLDFTMVDLDVPGYRHGGGKVPYQAGRNTIDCSEVSVAALGGYNGPSPPPGQVHTYQWTIRALDAKGGVIGQAVAQRKFPE